MFRAFFDESGTHGDARRTVIAGYVGDANTWSAVEAQWRELLDTYHLKSFHMVDALSQRGEFKRMPRSLVNDLCNALARLINMSDLHAVWSAVDAAVWMASTTDEFRAVFPKPYDLCFVEILRQLRAWARGTRRFGGIGLVFAAQHEYQGRSEKAFEWWRAHGGKSVRPPSFESSSERPALQAADMLVHQLYVSLKSLDVRNDGSGTIGLTALLNVVSKGELESGGFITENALKLRVANRDWIDPFFPCPAEQASSVQTIWGRR